MITLAFVAGCGTKNDVDPPRGPQPSAEVVESPVPPSTATPPKTPLAAVPVAAPVEAPSPWRVKDEATEVATVMLDAIDSAPDHALDRVAAAFSSTTLRGALSGSPDALFEAALSGFVDAVRATPRETAVLVNDDGTYHSPDGFWLDKVPDPSAPPSAEVTKALELARAGDAPGLSTLLASLEPQHPQYRQLVAAAQRYAKLCQDSPWTEIAWEKKQRVKGPMEDTVRARLAIEGFILGDEPLTESVTRYRHARQMSAVRRYIDEDLIEDLNIPCSERLATLRMNVKRWRHTAIRSDDKASVFVNLASQELSFVVGDEERVSSRVVVGSSRSYFTRDTKRRIFKNATPILTESIESVVINPDWNVPSRIARDEIEPAIEKDPDYLEKNHFRVVETSSGGKIYIQMPGAHNALGRLKVLFPNDEGVYLHDTPSKGKFQLPVRAASHGCVRVEKIQELGIALLNFDRETNPENERRLFDEWLLKSYINTKRTHGFRLNAHIPVYFEYYTASVGPVDGLNVVRFHPDVYNYDGESRAAVAAALAKGTGAEPEAAP